MLSLYTLQRDDITVVCEKEFKIKKQGNVRHMYDLPGLYCP